jgi:hypothetical protein
MLSFDINLFSEEELLEILATAKAELDNSDINWSSLGVSVSRNIAAGASVTDVIQAATVALKLKHPERYGRLYRQSVPSFC